MSGLDDYLKTIGEKPVGKGAVAGEGDRPDWRQQAAASVAREEEPGFGTGLAKSVAGTVTAIPKLGNRLLGLGAPELSDKLGDLAEQVPGVKRMEDFAASPNENWSETAGDVVGEGAQLLTGAGEWKWGPKLADLALRKSRAAVELPGIMRQASSPTFRSQELARKFPGLTTGSTFVKTAEEAASGLRKDIPTRSEKIARGVGNTAETLGRGAVTGVVTDPTDPGVGALAGAATAGAFPVLGAIAKSGAGGYMGGVAARGVVGGAVERLANTMGIPTSVLWAIGIPELFRFYHSPVGRALHGGGRETARKLGDMIARTDPRLPASAGGQIAEWLLAPTSSFQTGAAGEVTDEQEARQPRPQKH